MDYKDFEKKKKKPGPDDVGKPGYWFREEDPRRRAQALNAAAQALDKDQTTRRNMNLLHARLYGNFDLVGFGARQYNRGSIAASSRIALNVVEAGIDTLAAKISKHRPRPQTTTDGAQWSEQQKAKRLGRFGEGMFGYAKVYDKDDLIFIDSCVFGDGGYKLYMDEFGKVNVERVFIDELLVDEADAKYGAPRQMIQGRLCHKEVLKEMFPKYAGEIEAAQAPKGTEAEGFGDMVQVWEGWHLPSGPKAKDGYHSIALEDGDCELFGEKWTLPRFPFVFYQYKPRVSGGFWGKGVAEILTGIQLEINRLIRSISEQLRRKGKGRVFLPLSAKVPPEHLTNAIGDIVYFNGGVPPVVDNSNAVAAEDYAQLDRLYQKAFQIIGASELSVSAKKPSGLDAGVAIREFEEIESERFAKQHQRWDRFHCELVEAMFDMVREFGGSDYVTKYEHKRYMETIKWEDVAHERGAYSIKIVPSSSLPGTPAARRQAVKEMMADGFIDKAVAQKLLDMPDLEAETNLGNAAMDDVDFMIDQILNTDEEAQMPDKYSNLALIVERGTAAYLFAKNHAAPEERLAALARLIDQAAAKLIAGQEAPMPAPAPGVSPGSAPAPGAVAPPVPAGPMSNSLTMNMPPTPAVPPNIAGP